MLLGYWWETLQEANGLAQLKPWFPEWVSESNRPISTSHSWLLQGQRKKVEQLVEESKEARTSGVSYPGAPWNCSGKTNLKN